MTKRAGFAQEFKKEAAPFAHTSGRTRKEVAEDLGIGLSILTRWLSRNRDRSMNDASHRGSEEDMAAELKRLRRENEILLQERDILKKATVNSTCNATYTSSVYFNRCPAMNRNFTQSEKETSWSLWRQGLRMGT